jgi:hypothetical protein
MIDTLAQDARYGLRMLAKSPGFSAGGCGFAATAALVLAVGRGANTAIYSFRLGIRTG